MSKNPSHPSLWQEPEAFVRDKFTTAREGLERSVRDVTDFSQRNPERALLWALGTGYLLRIMPVGQIIVAIIRVLISLLKPGALVYVGIKILQQAQAVGGVNRPPKGRVERHSNCEALH